MIELIIIVPLVAGLVAFFLPLTMARPLLVLIGAVHLLLSTLLWLQRPLALLPDYFAITPEGLLSLIVISLLFFLISIYTTAYLDATRIHSENFFSGALLVFLASMTMVTLSDHLMVMWIAIEATTLASAPLIYTHRSAASFEATWKYVLICSVGIALALLGSLLIALSMDVGGVDAPVAFSALAQEAPRLAPVWLKAGFVFILVGYGTKMGLAPMHTWLPDAHSEAPSPVSALLSGVLLNCAFLGIFKTHKIMHAAGLGDFSGTILIFFGLASIIAAATFIIKQSEYKRLLAYSSIENMGIIALGTGIGGLGAYGAMLCLIHHSLIKSSLFLSAGNVLIGYGERTIAGTGRLVRMMPKTFVAFISGFAGISGFPPFGIFIGELLIIMAALRGGHFVAAAVFILSIAVIFAGFSRHVIQISFGANAGPDRLEEHAAMVWPQYMLLFTSLVLFIWMPGTLNQTIRLAVAAIGGGF
ncbi:MAG: proton-conducting transporter membrane subunit [Desulfobacteraceae bacterium]|nr:proton-conducting transporter membrane subunit [Desulfobacteraceae bacterium]